MSFTYEKTDESSGILRNKGRRCGSFVVKDGKYEVNIATASAKKAWAKEMSTDEDVNKFFTESIEEIAEEIAEEIVEEIEDYNFEKELFDRVSKDGNILAKNKDGNYTVYKGPLSDALVERIEKVDIIEKVITSTSGE